MFDRPQEFIRALTADGARFPDSLTLHAVLYRLCEAHAGTLGSCLNRTVWVERAQATENRTRSRQSRYPDTWIANLRTQLRELEDADAKPLLVACSGVLRALDDHHKRQQARVHFCTADLPDELGRGQTVFLAPPANPIAECVPQTRSLKRDRGHLANDLREILDLWWHVVALDRYPVKPRFVKVEPLGAELAERLAEDDLRIGLASPCADLEYAHHSDPDRRHPKKGIPYRFVGIKPEHLAKARSLIDGILHACEEQRIDVLCFPELTLDNDLLGHLQDRLAAGNPSAHPALVVTGSFHLSDAMEWVNRCHVLDEKGRILFAQDKCVAFQITPASAKEMGPDLCATLGIDEGGGYEDIRAATEVVIADSAIGRFATPICLDFCGDELRDLLIDCRVNLLLVPAMTPRIRPFAERTRDLGTCCRGSSFVVNSSWLLSQRGGQPAADRLWHGYVPAKGDQPPPERISDHLVVFGIRVLCGAS